MIKSIAERMLRSFGVDTRRISPPQAYPPVQAAPPSNEESGWAGALAREPLNGNLHLDFAVAAAKAGAFYLAYAELRTAQFLGADRQRVDALLDGFRKALPDPLGMNHNQYFRFISLSSEILRRAGCDDVSILDVGGGDGRLASFIHNAPYCLAEPTVNGISGSDLPFPDRSFDYVVSCHVLEHIPIDRRTWFLDQMLAKSRRGMILLNPFQVEGTHIEERLKLVLDVTGAQWAREHLECELPHLDEIRRYATDRGLEMNVTPNGTLTTTMAFVFVDYFATKCGRHDDWEKVNRFFNAKCTELLDSAEFPNAYLIHLGRATGEQAYGVQSRR